jgi:hypothetical protein
MSDTFKAGAGRALFLSTSAFAVMCLSVNYFFFLRNADEKTKAV